ncbi:hypothetical protein HK096_010784, partial [Nowakowskiella sp. JEL0078]
IASGSGQHIHSWATAFPNVHFQPTELYDLKLHNSIRSYTSELSNVSEPVILNALENTNWEELNKIVEENGFFDVVYFGNLLHISPWEVTLALADKLPRVLKEGGVLLVYGPFKKDGIFTTPSNEEVSL